MSKVTALGLDTVHEGSGHQMTGMAVSVCTTPAAPSPLPIPYPTMGTVAEGIIDAPMRTTIEGKKILTVGGCMKACHGNEPGTMREVLSLNTGGPCFPWLGAPNVLVELGMAGITGSMGQMNKSVTAGAGTAASGAGGAGGAGGGEAGGGAGAPGGGGPSAPGGGGGGGGGRSHKGAKAGKSSSPPVEQCTTEGHPVDVTDGAVVDAATDLSVPGMIPLVWARHYRSSRCSERDAALGPGWAFSYDQWIEEGEQVLALRDGEGRWIWFEKVEPGETTFHRRERLELHREGAREYRVVELGSRQVRLFAAEGGSARALLRAIRDVHGNEIRLDYEGERLVRVVDTAGRELKVRWKEGRITRLELWAERRLGQWVDYRYDRAGCLIAAVDAVGGVEAYEVDVRHRMSAATLKNGERFWYAYEDHHGHRCRRTGGRDGLHEVELRRDARAKTTEVRGEEPRVYTWNADGLVTRAALPDGTVLWERAYDEDALLVAEANGAGEGVQRWYDARGNVIREVDALGNETQWEREGDLVVREISPEGLLTQVVRDARGEVSAVLLPTGEVYSFARDERGRVTGVYGHGGGHEGLLLGYEHDAQHNVIAETDARGARTAYAYDAMGRPMSRTDALGRTTRVAYDPMGRPVRVERPDGTRTVATYDRMGNPARLVDALGQTTQLAYEGTGVLAQVVEPGGGVWRFAYTKKERLRAVTNPKSERYVFHYDAAGRVAQEDTFDGRTLRYGYRSSGRLGRVEQAADGTWRDLFYDRAGNLTADETPDGAIGYARDRMGRLLGAVLEESSGQRIETWFERDRFGRVVCERQGDEAVRYAYDPRGRRTERVMPDGARTRYAYDALGALSAVEHDGHRVVFERDVLGREVQRTSGTVGEDDAATEAAIAVRSAYDAMDRLIEQRATAPAPGVPKVLVTRQWLYDAGGRVERIDDARWGATAYRYDRVDRLLSAQRGTVREVFSYDPAGSITRMLQELAGKDDLGLLAPAQQAQDWMQPSWQIDPGGVLRRTETAAYEVDARGRRTAKVELAQYRANHPNGGSVTEQDMTRYTWDCRDRLREVRRSDGTRVVMTYDAFGRRICKEVSSQAATNRPRRVDFVWDGDVLAADVDSERGARTFVHAPGTFVPLLQQQDGRVLTYVNDHLGTPKELLDPRGLVAWAAAHSAWGKVTEVWRDPISVLSHRTTVESPFRLLGQYADEETGLCYTRFRFFDPEIGGWCSPDPLGIRGGSGLFRLDGSPTSSIDPFGLSSYTPSDVNALIADSNPEFPLTQKNAENILGTGPTGSTARVAGSGGAGADVTFEDPHGNIVGRREVKCIGGSSQGAFNKQVSHAAKAQAGSGGEVFVQVKRSTSPDDASRMVARFRGSRTADDLTKYSGTKLVITDTEGNTLYSGPLSCNGGQ
ncbi:PAAR-like domain-containing protein [Sorangium sp. So ce764]|uniref:PAAR-like domain-containing protein n=1 Tax=Sorangium sp. So ce764 TaxID=3133320 RepID=UPI003F5FF853